MDELGTEWRIEIERHRIEHTARDIGRNYSYWKWCEFECYRRPSYFRIVCMFVHHNKVMVF
jgi:hypothetical protein